ncbi:hypothetical protein KI387_028333, partial [Taxus chinensis]
DGGSDKVWYKGRNGHVNEHGFTKKNLFGSIGRRELLSCPNFNPYLKLSVDPPGPLKDVQELNITISGVLVPHASDWIAIVTPSSVNYTDCPSVKRMYVETGDVARLPLLCQYPLKFQFLLADPDYLTCKKKRCQKSIGRWCLWSTCSGTISARVVNIRTDIRIIDEVGWSAVNKFTTPPAVGSGELTFITYGDMGKAERDGFGEHYIQPGALKVIDAVEKEVDMGEISMILHIGDISYATGFMAEWDFFLEMIGAVASRVPYMTAIGNHERDFPKSGSYYEGLDSGGECGVPYEKYFQMPVIGQDKPWYSIEHGPVHFTVMSTEHSWDIGSEQFNWMKTDLASVDRKRTPWLIFAGHRPQYSSFEGGFVFSTLIPAVDIHFRSVIEPLLLSHQVDLALWGHVHNYERTCAVNNSKCLNYPMRDHRGFDNYKSSEYYAPVHVIIGMSGFELDSFMAVPLPIPSQKWESVSMDFVTGLPNVNGKTCMYVVVDRLTKYAHFFPLPTKFDGPMIADLYFREVLKLHGVPKNIVSDRDIRFMSLFWQELFRLAGTELTSSTSYHPQMNGQTKIVNTWAEGYLRYYVLGQQLAWIKWLHLADFCYNTTHHMSIGMSSFKALYGYDANSFIDVMMTDNRVPSAQELVQQSMDIVKSLKENLHHAQNRQKLYVDKHRRERTFDVDDWVFLRLQPYRQSTLKQSGKEKLKPRFYGPYKVTKRIGEVAYELELPGDGKIHNVFHVSCIKKALGQNVVPSLELPLSDEEGKLILIPETIMETRERNLRKRVIKEYLVKWKDLPLEDATWENASILEHPSLQLLEGKQFWEGRAVMSLFL